MIDSFFIIPRMGGVAYLNMPKAACSSINIALSRFREKEGFTPPREVLPDGSEPIHGFYPQYAHTEYFFKRWPVEFPPLPASFIRFSFVRNPYERIYSFYKSKIDHGQKPGKFYEKFGIYHGCTFEQCVNILTSIDPNELEHHTIPQSMILRDGDNLLIDFIGKVESFYTDWLVIQNITGFNIELERANKIKLKSDFVLSDDSANRLFEYYHDDFLLFDYPKETIYTDAKPIKSNYNKSVHTDHHYNRIKLDELKSKITKRSNNIRHLAENFELNPELREKYFAKQKELFNELIMKNLFSLEMNQKNIKISQNKIIKGQKELKNKFSLTRNHFSVTTAELSKSKVVLNNTNEELIKTNSELNILKDELKRLKSKVMYYYKLNDIAQKDYKQTMANNLLADYQCARHSFKNKIIRAFNHLFGVDERSILLKSNAVDSGYYFCIYQDTIKGGMSAASHYVRFGAQEGRNPSKDFNTIKYLFEHPEVVKKGSNPLVHYIIHQDQSINEKP